MSRKTKKREGVGCCTACGKEWVEHPGVQRTCAALLRERERRIALEAEVAFLKENAGAVYGAQLKARADKAIEGLKTMKKEDKR